MAVVGVILDVGGTLVRSNEARARAWAGALAESGYTVPVERITPLIGMGAYRLLPLVAPGLSSRAGIGQRIVRRVGELFVSRYTADLEPAPGARTLVERMRDEGLRLIVASDAMPDEVTALLKAADLDDLLQERFTAADLVHAKPTLELVELARGKVGLWPDASLLIGDAPYDIEAAARAGMRTIALRCGGHSDVELAGALAIYDNPADLLAHYAASPLDRNARPFPPPRPHDSARAASWQPR